MQEHGGKVEMRTKLRAAIEQIKRHLSESKAKSIDLQDQLQSAIGKLRHDVLEEFRTVTWPHLRKLDEVLQTGQGLPVPALSACGFGTAEVRYTKLLAYYLDARNHHGLGGRLTQAIFAHRIEAGRDLPWAECSVEAEFPLGKSMLSDKTERRNSLDLLIKVGKRRILVEQKINSTEGEEQLRRYSDAARALFSNPLDLFFLTPEGRGGSDVEWTEISHDELLCDMASVLDSPDVSPTARHNLRTLLWDLAMGPLAQDAGWINDLGVKVRFVAEDYNRCAEIKSWFQRQGMSYDTLKIVAKLAE
ncbi:MAG: PD-(D/E)XK nuclease family protein [Chthoniobacterales bacterium]|nr:PD-(D/E)XK nuclease family protein [Chthoniobacterales bacterium]